MLPPTVSENDCESNADFTPTIFNKVKVYVPTEVVLKILAKVEHLKNDETLVGAYLERACQRSHRRAGEEKCLLLIWMKSHPERFCFMIFFLCLFSAASSPS